MDDLELETNESKTKEYKEEIAGGDADDFRELDVSQTREAVDKNYIPEGFESKEAFLKDMREEYELDVQADDDNRKEAIDDKKFAAGEQWDPRVLQHREGLPNLIINSIPQFIAQLVGDWRQSRNAIKVLPAEDGDVEVASVRSDLVRAIEYQSRADRVYDEAFESSVQCGDGAFRVDVEYAKDDVFDQDIFLRKIEDPLSVVWDRFSFDPTGKDARHVYVDDEIPLKEFNRKWPKANPSALSNKVSTELTSTGWLDGNSVRVTSYWRMIERDRLLGLFQDGSIHIMTSENYGELHQKYGAPVRTRISPCLYAQMHLVTGWDILAGPYEYRLNRLPIIRVTGRTININGKRVRYGLVRFMKDSVRLRNFWRSTMAEQLGYAPKAQWMATESAVAGRESTIREAHLSRDPLLIFNDEADFGRNVQRVDPPQMQAALMTEVQVNTQDMKDVTGIHDASLGIKSNETSGKAIMARQREGDIASVTYYDNANAAILEAGDVINQLIPAIYDSTRIIRIIGEDETPKLLKINDPSDPSSPNLATGNYDVALTSGTSYTTRRAEAADAMMQAVQVWPNLIAVAGDIIAKAQDWPGADKLAERLKKTIPQQLLDPEEQDPNAPAMDPQQIQQMGMELQALQQENAAMKMDKELEIRKLDIDWYNAETQRIRALSDNQVDGNQMEMDAIGRILDHTDKDNERAHQMEVIEKQLEAKRAMDAQKNAQAQAQGGSGGTPSDAS